MDKFLSETEKQPTVIVPNGPGPYSQVEIPNKTE